MAQPLDFQSIIMALQHYWAEYGCLIWQPYYTQVGAGTYNPATFLRVLGPEPWNVAYVEPSIRPDDGRYGENPNRMQMHYQFQVILKPDPGNPQEVYLKSLGALGIDPREHDIRFVEDNWESPALGAWGLGWEVWLDGQEITQFTYFQQAGGITLDPVSVEITYGLERIAMALQQVSDFRQIRWNERFTDGDINLQAEQEHSKYYFEIADVKRLEEMFELFESEANACLEEGLVLPAHDYVLKCSHTFNVLDTRGAVGVTQRQAFFGRMRELSRKVAQAYVDQRQRLEYPWLRNAADENQTQAVESIPQPKPQIDLQGAPTTKTPFLFEIGTEELPAGDLTQAVRHLEKHVPQWLADLRLSYDSLQVLGTPRRLVIYVEGLSPRQSDLEELVKGPPAARAYDADGKPTKAAQGFARSKGVSVDDLEIRQIGEGRYVVAVARQGGRPSLQVLAEKLPEWVASLRFDKSMRWNQSNVNFSRPLRWFLALLGDEHRNAVVPFEYGGLNADRQTRGLRFLEPEQVAIHSPGEYFEFLKSQGIVLDISQRREKVLTQAQELAAQVGGVVLADEALIEEVTNLVEAPQALLGSFDPEHLKLPREVLVSVMKKHQRYFPVVKAERDDEAELLPYFITIRNGDGHGLDVVRAGNEHVIRARFADAAYFVREDLKKPLEAYLPKLETMTFQDALGSMLDKSCRLESLVEALGEMFALEAEERTTLQRAAHLCKADLATQMVVEMTSLQGIMGRYYALHSEEPQAVAEAIFEHYLPRFSGDILPHTKPGMVLSIADRLDSLAGLFAVGLAPSGNKDPFALRRAALGLVQILIAKEIDFNVRLGLEMAAEHLPVPLTQQRFEQVLAFIIERLRFTLLEEGRRFDVVDAVLAAQGVKPHSARRAVQQLESWVQREDWHIILPAYARCVRITRDLQERYQVQESAFVEPEEKALWKALREAESVEREPGSADDFLNAFTPMIPEIDMFFEKVLVMSENESLQRNRLALLQRVAALAEGVADLSRLEGF